MNVFNIITVLLSASLANCAQIKTQSFSAEPEYQEVNPGGIVVLSCKVNNIGGECRWEKDGAPVGLHPSKYEWAGIPDSGDCSLKILEANLNYDDGLWQCQVTPSSFLNKDHLVSRGAQLTVRQSPKHIEIQRVGDSLTEANAIVASAGEDVEVKCIVSGGNPASKIKWFSGNEEIMRGHTQEDTSSPASRTWVSVSKLRLPVTKADNGGSVKCVAEHPALTKAMSSQINLKIHYPPVVRIETSNLNYLEEEKDPANLRCVVDANPPATVLWKKQGINSIFSTDHEINFSPVSRHTAGVYSCVAENALGLSQPASVDIDVKYGPSILNVGPSKIVSAQMNKQTMLNCEAEGNPKPRYQWLQKLPTQEVLIRGYEKTLIIDDVTYDHQGEFVCKAINTIRGEERSVQSDPIRVEVSGAPQVMKYAAQHEVRVQNGEDAILDVLFCADPLPKQAWHLGDLGSGTGNNIILAAGTGHGRFMAESLKKASKEDCYISTLRINGVVASDSHHYHLKLSNDQGSDDHTIHLVVKDQVSQESLIAVVCGAVLTLVLLLVVCFYCCRSQSGCCTSGGNEKSGQGQKNKSKGFNKPTDLESDRTDCESTNSGSQISGGSKNQHPHQQMHKNLVHSVVAIPPDALYLGHNPEIKTSVIPDIDMSPVNPDNHKLYYGYQPQMMTVESGAASASSTSSFNDSKPRTPCAMI